MNFTSYFYLNMGGFLGKMKALKNCWSQEIIYIYIYIYIYIHFFKQRTINVSRDKTKAKGVKTVNYSRVMETHQKTNGRCRHPTPGHPLVTRLFSPLGAARAAFSSEVS